MEEMSMQQGCVSSRDSAFATIDAGPSVVVADAAAQASTDSSHPARLLQVCYQDVEQVSRLAETLPGGLANIQDIYPLSALQQGMLFHHVENENYDTYVLSVLFS